MDIDKELSQINHVPGVYKFFDQDGKILYIGKAVNLRNRVWSYFRNDHPGRPLIDKMVPLIEKIETIETENDVEALILEANLVKKYRPFYNLALKDDKTHSWIYIDTHNPFPKIKKVRERDKKGKYFGPYPNGRPINSILKYLRQIYPYADCNLKFYDGRSPESINKKRVCLFYHIGQCQGPCDNLVSKEEYKKSIDEIIKTLEGKRKRHVSRLERKMEKYAKDEKFEEAALLRDKVYDLKYLSQKIHLKEGDTEEEFKELKKERNLAGIYEILKLANQSHKNPNDTRIECYDISNTAGKLSYGSMTVSEGTKIMQSKYRIFKIKGKSSPDDFRMLNEVLERRLKHVRISSDESLIETPGIILIDGGKGQLGAITHELPMNTILMGISKGKRLKKVGMIQQDEYWLKTKNGVKKIQVKNPYIFQQLRDEAHRFAIKHHRRARKQAQRYSVLDEIKGVGEERKRLLIRKFKSVKGIRAATEEQINKVIKNSKVAKRIKKRLN